MSQSLDERFDALVSQVIAPALKPLGYRTSRLVWTRVGHDAIHTIVLQRSQRNAPGHLRFYVELSAYVAGFARAIGATVPDDITKAAPQYTRRFESVTEWPGQWVDLEEWTDADLHPALSSALGAVDAHLSGISTADELADALASRGPLNLDRFAWSCAHRDRAAIDSQIGAARAEFGAEDRWPRLFAQFDRTAARFDIELGASA